MTLRPARRCAWRLPPSTRHVHILPPRPAAINAEPASTASRPSTRSRRPPWPGIMPLVSLTPKRRFSQIRARSPACVDDGRAGADQGQPRGRTAARRRGSRPPSRPPPRRRAAGKTGPGLVRADRAAPASARRASAGDIGADVGRPDQGQQPDHDREPGPVAVAQPRSAAGRAARDRATPSGQPRRALAASRPRPRCAATSAATPVRGSPDGTAGRPRRRARDAATMPVGCGRCRAEQPRPFPGAEPPSPARTAPRTRASPNQTASQAPAGRGPAPTRRAGAKGDPIAPGSATRGAIAAFASVELGDRLLQVLLAEVGPQRVDEDQLGIGRAARAGSC